MGKYNSRKKKLIALTIIVAYRSFAGAERTTLLCRCRYA